MTIWGSFVAAIRSSPAASRSAGQAMVEFAFTFILFFGMVVAILEGARLVTSAFVLNNAAREGARAGMFIAASDDHIRTKVNQTASQIVGTLPTGNIAICRRATVNAACGSTPIETGSTIDVTVTHTVQLVPFAGGWLGQASVPLTGYHRARVE